MSFLGEAFPEEFRRQFVEQNLQIGTILRMHVNDTIPPKIKFFVVIAFCDDNVALGVVYINSEINPNLFPTEELKNLHIQINPDHRNLVDASCFIDCSKIYEKRLADITEALKDQPESHRGCLNSVEIGNIQQTLYSARTISKRDKRKYGLI